MGVFFNIGLALEEGFDSVEETHDAALRVALAGRIRYWREDVALRKTTDAASREDNGKGEREKEKSYAAQVL